MSLPSACPELSIQLLLFSKMKDHVLDMFTRQHKGKAENITKVISPYTYLYIKVKTFKAVYSYFKKYTNGPVNF